MTSGNEKGDFTDSGEPREDRHALLQAIIETVGVTATSHSAEESTHYSDENAGRKQIPTSD